MPFLSSACAAQVAYSGEGGRRSKVLGMHVLSFAASAETQKRASGDVHPYGASLLNTAPLWRDGPFLPRPPYALYNDTDRRPLHSFFTPAHISKSRMSLVALFIATHIDSLDSRYEPLRPVIVR